jgi:hypothetical protein
MTVQTKKISPTYVSFYVAGSDSVDVPINFARVDGILATPDCLNIPALYYNDGDTTVTLGHASEIEQPRAPDYDGMLETPNKVVLLFDAEVDEFMSIRVPSLQTRICVWINHPTSPDEVVIAVGD